MGLWYNSTHKDTRLLNESSQESVAGIWSLKQLSQATSGPHTPLHISGVLSAARNAAYQPVHPHRVLSHVLQRPILAPQDVSWLRLWYFLSWASFWLLFWLLSSLVAKYLCEIKSLVDSPPTVYILQHKRVSGRCPCALETSVNLV